MVRALVNAEIPVMGHVGLTPQSVLAFGGFKVQAKTEDAATEVIQGAKDLEAAGCFALVVEGVPVRVGTAITEALDIPTIGIGAGPDTDGQVLVFHDLLGWTNRKPPKFVRVYGALNSVVTDAIASFAGDVRSGAFPAPQETYDSPNS
jgi:3-methyl-2-oxobutanoate hydroxymethyltransferase